LPVDFDFYSEMSEKAMEIMKSQSDIFEYIGRDEAYLDVTERVGGDFDKASHLAQQIKNSIRDKIKLSCSIGISPNKLVSKIASDFHKPDGLTVVPPDKMDEFLESQIIRVIPGIGKKTEEKFSVMNLKTIGDLKKLDIFTLNKEFGRKNGTFIYNAVRGIDNEPVKKREATLQYSKITTLKKDSKDYQFLSESIRELCKEVHGVLIKNNRMFKSIGIHFVQSDLSNKSKSRMLRSSITSLEELQRNADQLLKEALENQAITIRRLGVKVSELSEVQGQRDITSYF
jgi:DNA polymerase IV (DinB-like DNA polymerase)